MPTWSVLIADDDPDTRFVFGTFLRHYGVHVLEASSGPEAARLLVTKRPDALFYDPAFVELEGPLRRVPPYTRAAVALSASILPRRIVAELESRGIHLLQKPCPPSQVLRLLHDLLDPAQPTAPSAPSTSGATSRREEASPNA